MAGNTHSKVHPLRQTQCHIHWGQGRQSLGHQSHTDQAKIETEKFHLEKKTLKSKASKN